RAGADTALARIARAVEDAQGSKAAIARLADRVSAVFVPIVLTIATLTFVGWLATGHTATQSLATMIAVLVIACPCALGLATPAAVAVGTARGAELGLLFRGGDALERAASIDVVCLDKTGTLTTGHPRLVSTLDDDVLRLAASAEQHSEHPIARAIVDAAKTKGLALARAENVTVEAGGGLTSVVEGRAIKIGSRAFVASDLARGTSGGSAIATSAGSAIATSGVAAIATGDATSFIVIDGDVRGAIEIADLPRDDAATTIAALRGLGVEPVMITGDKREAADRVAAEVGITRVHAEIKPTGKAALVEAEKARGKRVAMVGDGINDAPALAAADLGIALATGTDIAAAAADVTLLRGGIGALPTALTLARATMRTIRRNLAAAFVYNAICIPIAAAGLLSPVLASAAMSLSSVSVLASSLRLRRFRA
ncbi:MAG TPA: heavy metal translocating P-type ATPase, partial [Kofleriaceae bacterium]|nr:heavy metal translocating P-type ATPase [Kofleriaceae bacterium]